MDSYHDCTLGVSGSLAGRLLLLQGRLVQSMWPGKIRQFALEKQWSEAGTPTPCGWDGRAGLISKELPS